MDTLVSESEWMRNRGVALMDAAVTALIDASCAVGHRGVRYQSFLGDRSG
ncbi:hypothetical protein Hanom_Chr03g00218171 [Helianthus anomalus]